MAGHDRTRVSSSCGIFPICSGTLLSSTVFLTAAHCTADYLVELAPLGWEVVVSFSSPTAGLLDQLAATGGLQSAVFTVVGYGVQNRVVGGGVPYFEDMNPIPRMYALSSFNALGPGYLRLSQNPAKGDGGSCFGDSATPTSCQ